MKLKPGMQRLYYASRSFVKRNSATILTCMGGAGVVVTAVMAAKATPKALWAIELAKEEKNDRLTTFEIVKAAAPSYVPAAVTGLSTIVCIFGANAINRRRQAALISAYGLLESQYKEYKKKVEEMLGEGTNDKIREALVKDKYKDAELPEQSEASEKRLFYEEHYGKFFESTIEDVIAAEYNFNRNFVLRGYACLNEFLDFLGIGPVIGGNTIGWSIDVGEVIYGYSWVDFYHEVVRMDDGLEVYMIKMPFEPTCDFLDPV